LRVSSHDDKHTYQGCCYVDFSHLLLPVGILTFYFFLQHHFRSYLITPKGLERDDIFRIVICSGVFPNVSRQALLDHLYHVAIIVV
jgi:hypothetical protein